VTTLVRSGRPHDDLDDLRARVSELETTLAERDADLARLKAGLAAFRISYRRRVGRLHEQLDDLERAIDEAELGILSERVTRAVPDEAPDASAGPARQAPARSLTSDAVRKLFRDVARTIHPDLARDQDARERRHRLMIEANRAYALGDEERLRWILEAWEKSPDAVNGGDIDAIRVRLSRRITEIEEQLTLCAGELADLKETSLWKLKAMVDEEAAKGNDLMADMIRRLNRDILAARNRLDAIRPRH
jgi:hypothetical protein